MTRRTREVAITQSWAVLVWSTKLLSPAGSVVDGEDGLSRWVIVRPP